MPLPTPLTPTQANGAGDIAEIHCVFLEGDHVGSTLFVAISDPELQDAVDRGAVVIAGPLPSGSPAPPLPMFISSVAPNVAFNEAGVVLVVDGQNFVAGAVLRIGSVTGDIADLSANQITATFDLSSSAIGDTEIKIYRNAIEPVAESGVPFEIEQEIIPPAAVGYWQFISMDSNDTAVTVGNIEVYETAGGPNLLTGGTPRGQFTSAQPTTEGTNVNWTDGSQATVVTSTTAARDTMRLTYQRPATPILANKMRLWPGAANVSQKRQAPLCFAIRTSPDNVTYKTVDFQFTGLWDDNLAEAPRDFDISMVELPVGLGRSNARAWGINILEDFNTTSVFTNVAILEFAATPGGPTILTGGHPIANRSYAYGVGANDRSTRQAFDGLASTRYSGGLNAFPIRVGYGRKTPLGDAQQVRLTAFTSEVTGMPRDFEVWYSEDFVTRTVVATFNALAAWTAGEMRAFAI